MRGLPQELFLALIFGAVLMAQFLYKQWRRKSAFEALEPEPATSAAARPSPIARTQAASAETGTADTRDTREARLPLAAARAATQAWAPPAQPPTRRRPRRYSRTALMRDRHAVQNAVVIATILQPCHACRPQGVD
jgi:uncharacterized SAM-binding protein YcdF (DUF218 family)